MSLFIVRALVGALILGCSTPAGAAVFGFDGAAATNAQVPLAITTGGSTATFSSPTGAGAFIAEDGSAFGTLGSSVLANDNFTPEELDIGFSQVFSVISFRFATNDSGAPTAVTLTQTLDGQVVGTATSLGTVAASGIPEGGFNLAGTRFNGVRITDTAAGNAGFAIGAVSVPEPSMLPVTLAGLLGLTMLRRRAR